jgi:hypothetical protein
VLAPIVGNTKNDIGLFFLRQGKVGNKQQDKVPKRFHAFLRDLAISKKSSTRRGFYFLLGIVKTIVATKYPPKVGILWVRNKKQLFLILIC